MNIKCSHCEAVYNYGGPLSNYMDWISGPKPHPMWREPDRRSDWAADHLREAADALVELLKEVEELRRQLKERGEQ
jgi:hypothetical protein